MLSALLSGCHREAHPSGEEDDPVEDCGVSLDALWPLDGHDDVYYRANFEFRLSEPDRTAHFSTEIPGTEELSTDELTVTFRPDEPLQPDADYGFAVDYCAGHVDVAFTTSHYGAPLSDGGAIDGRTYAWPRPDAELPQGLGSLLFGSGEDLLLNVRVTGDSTLELLLGGDDESAVHTQDCSATNTFANVDFTGAPYFSGAADVFVYPTSFGSVEVTEARLDGTFSEDGLAVAIVLSGILDTRTLDIELFGALSDWCEEFAPIYDACFACPDGEPMCLDVLTQLDYADAVDGVPVTEVTTDEQATCEALAYTYSLDPSSGVVVEPNAVGDLLVPYLDAAILLSPTSLTSTAPFVGAVGDPSAQQDYCAATFELAASDRTLPTFSVTTDGFTTTASDGTDVAFSNVTISGEFNEDRTTLRYVTLDAALDTRALSEKLNPDGRPSSFCDAASALGTDCYACPDGAPYCVDVRVHQLTADLLPDLQIWPVAAPGCDGCEEGPPATDTCVE